MVRVKKSVTKEATSSDSVLDRPVLSVARDVNSSPLWQRALPAVFLGMLVMSFGMGALWQKVIYLEQGGVVRNQVTDTTGQAPTQPTNLDGKLTADQAKKLPPVTKEDIIEGSPTADIILIEYSDLQCPFCERFHATAKEVVAEYKGRIAWVYRHFPLDSIHPQARPAAIASECVREIAGNAGFWKYSDYLFTNQETALNDLPGSAAKVGFDQAKVKACLDANKYADLVEKQYQGGIQAGVTGTPGNFIVNKKGEVWLIPGAVPADTLKKTIEEALAS